MTLCVPSLPFRRLVSHKKSYTYTFLSYFSLSLKGVEGLFQKLVLHILSDGFTSLFFLLDSRLFLLHLPSLFILILYNTVYAPIQASRGLFVYSTIHGIFTTNSISSTLFLIELVHCYAFHAGP